MSFSGGKLWPAAAVKTRQKCSGRLDPDSLGQQSPTSTVRVAVVRIMINRPPERQGGGEEVYGTAQPWSLSIGTRALAVVAPRE